MIFAQSSGEVIECPTRFAIFTKRESGSLFFFFLTTRIHVQTSLSLWVWWKWVENIRKSEENYYFVKKVCLINKLAWMFCKSDDILIKILFKEKCV